MIPLINQHGEQHTVGQQHFVNNKAIVPTIKPPTIVHTITIINASSDVNILFKSTSDNDFENDFVQNLLSFLIIHFFL